MLILAIRLVISSGTLGRTVGLQSAQDSGKCDESEACFVT